MKKAFYFLLAAMLCAGLAGCSKATQSGEIKLADGQTLLIGKIDSISGNELTVSLMEEVTTTDSSGQGVSSTQLPQGTGMPNGQSGRQRPSVSGSGYMQTPDAGSSSTNSGSTSTSGTRSWAGRSGQSSGTNQTQGSSYGNSTGGSNPDSSSGSEQPSGAGQSIPASSPSSTAGSGNQAGSQTSGSANATQKVTQYQKTGETKTMLILVNTPVTTQLGAVTTFARLAADDTIKMVMQDDVVMAIYIVG